ncbi:protein dachsous [Anopheles merus]|uniref:protein dachsous n=1 Tax=Anopheles merus TaxID=30066 RepID=UPI001BE46A21|nr:protein dachsous [Anopheles merus]XP_041779585.1 protein dachsous [Anopheles merus]XP_041779587.1 protein dachsous [Anopheles merus]XP_041779588.1 protein dachsous [Anopheles merus]
MAECKSRHGYSSCSNRHRKMSLLWLLLMICAFSGDSGGGGGPGGFIRLAAAEHVRELEVSEGVPIGHQIGFIGEFVHDENGDSGPPYLIVPVPGSAVDTDLAIDHTTGEIRTKVALDRENRSSYSLVAIPLSGENVRVVVRVLDENDNAPTFPTPIMSIEFPENTPRDVKRTLNPARDADLGRYNTQRYSIVSGNVNNAFRLSSHRERDGVLYLDLQINGFLDRETTPAYSLVVEALDGGSPPLRGQMTVNITIQDVNDNQPIFNQSRYFATVPENATLGTTVLQVYATDQDAGENGQVEYAINRRQSDKEQMFRIDPATGLISVNKPLDFETRELHELVVVAKDRGMQPLETTAFVSIRVTDVNDNQPIINVIFLSDDATPKISESAQPGEFVARISVNDPDSRTEYANVNVTLSGGEGHFGLTTRDNIIYLVIVSLPLDREIKPNYTLSVIATDTGNPPLHAAKDIFLTVTDINDNAPEFEKDVYHANVMEVADPGTSVIQVTAVDRDEGNNSAIVYSLLDTPDTHSHWFQIDSHSGLITTRAHIDCETDPVPQLIVMAQDNGRPPLSSTGTVLVTIHDVNDNEPIFDQSFYNVSVAENESKGRCILKVSATDPDCGVNAMVNYTLGEGYKKNAEFEIRPSTGEVCIASELDYETRNSYEFPIIATDRGGLSTTAMVKIQLTDVNDNRPTFYPREYNVSLRESMPTNSLLSTPVVVVVATDSDSGSFGTISYRIVAGNEAGIFRMDRLTGEIFVTRPNMLSSRTQPYHRLNISASDGGGLRSTHDAEVFISVIDATQRPPIFDKPRYTYYVKEDVKRNTVVGTVSATSSNSGNRGSLRYFIYSGDPDGFFAIDPVSGNIRVANALDHETKPQVLLNIQATSGDPPAYGHTQVNIDIEDVNDNPPEFESNTVRISVPENVEIGSPLYEANAQDKDSGMSGVITYMLAGQGNTLSGARSSLFSMDSRSGHLTLARPLDYESMQRHTLVVTASDSGTPSLSTNLTILVEVQDVNDNAPIFEKNEYAISVIESTPSNSQILQVSATDADTGNNARLTYKILGEDHQRTGKSTQPASPDEPVAEIFGIFPNSGWIYLRTKLDREVKERYNITVIVSDNGVPTLTATAHVIVTILDANDNSPIFAKSLYEFEIEENMRRGAMIGTVSASDSDAGINAVVRYSLIPSNTSFQINPVSGEITTRDSLDRETKASYDLVVEARDQGTPYRSSRVSVKVQILDVNDNAPDIVDPQEDVVSVREEQPIGTEVVKVRAIDRDHGQNASISYSILKGRDSDGYGMFSIDPMSGVIRTKTSLDHEEKTIYRLAVAATDNGKPPKQTVRLLRIEVLDLNDNRPTFTSSSLVFRLREDVGVGHIIGSISGNEQSDAENFISSSSDLHITYTLTPLTNDITEGAFDIDRNSGKLVVARQLDREQQSEYRMEIRALDTSASNNPQSSAVTVKIEIADVNDNPPKWPSDPINVYVSEDTPVGAIVYNFTVQDNDTGTNAEIKYNLSKPAHLAQKEYFAIDSLTGSLTLLAPLDHEDTQEFLLIVQATDQSSNVTERLTTSATARIMVTDVNDNSPKFVIPQAADGVVYISDSLEIDQVVSHVVAIDPDSGENGHIAYTFVGGNEDERFTIDSSTGVIRLAKPFSSNFIMDSGKRNSVSGKYQLVISASDHGSPRPREAKMTLQVVIQNMTNNPPRFVEPVYHVNITENVPSGSFVVRVSARSHSDGGSGAGLNLTYEIPKGVGEDHFAVDSVRGIVTTRGTFDRESKDLYTIPIYVTEGGRFKKPSSSAASSQDMAQFDVATLVVRVTDVNDHAPEFVQGSCYPLAVPENSELSVIHTVVATDADDGLNGEITYSISGGNMGNKFSIDLHTGALTARPLDREVHARYVLQITAQDRGSPVSHQGHCNITIRVEDENDNDPKFELQKYIATIDEDAQIGTTVLTVKAIDADVGINARIVYSLANVTEWLFDIDSKTGVITTAGLFDRERQNVYNFMVVAMDGGRYNARSQNVPVQVIIADVNDNKPVFDKYPFREQIGALVQPGQTLLHISATDSDQGSNGEIVYSLNENASNGKFRINPTTGALSATQSLASENGRLLHIEVTARDKGNPPQIATGLIELRVGEVQQELPVLRFQNSSYRVTLSENTPVGQPVLQLSAVRSDGRRQKIIYSFGSGNEDGTFSIDAVTGDVRIRNSHNLDYERFSRLKSEGIELVAVARTDGTPLLYGYTSITVELRDENDNAPRFTQQQYAASVWEGNSKGTFVIKVGAFDSDQGANARILYHIVDGNHDNAFIIEPAFSGIVKTNIVLDREIRDKYKLKVIATDEGVPQMTGTATINVNVVDVNDNQPTFPPNTVISVSEATSVGTVLTTITANDVDTNPPLTYSFAELSDDDATSYFSIDRYSGKIILIRPLDYEDRHEFLLRLLASDSAHVARTTLTVRVVDVNDNAPVFQQITYHAMLSDSTDGSNTNVMILSVNATDADSEPNAIVRYSIVPPKGMVMASGFTIDESTGQLFANVSQLSTSGAGGTLYLTVRATDSGQPALSSTTTVRLEMKSKGKANPQYIQSQYRVSMNEEALPGTTVVNLIPKSILQQQSGAETAIAFEIIDGNEGSVFDVTYPEGAIVLVDRLDRERVDYYELKLVTVEPGTRHISRPDASLSTIIRVIVTVEDANDNAPEFQPGSYEATIGELAPIKHSIAKLSALDADLSGSPSSEVIYQIISGNDSGMFSIDLVSGLLYTNKYLDYDHGPTQYSLVVRACDSHSAPRCSVHPFTIALSDENDNEPQFPVPEYLEFVGENEPIGISIFTARATDMDRGPFGTVNYTIDSVLSGAYSGLDDSWKLFKVDPTSGVVNSNAVFDYEEKNRYAFALRATDTGGKSKTVRVKIVIESRDEFSPQFTERTYRFVIKTPESGQLPVGYVVGHVTATDRDRGPDGRIVYQLTTQHPYFKMNRTTGAILIKKRLDNVASMLEAGRDISLVVTAGSGRQGSLTNMTVVEIAIDALAHLKGNELGSGSGGSGGYENSQSVSAGGGFANWAVGLVISLLLIIVGVASVFLFLHMRNRQQKHVNKTGLSSESVGHSNNYVDPSAFDTIPIRGSSSGATGAGQFAPPKYDEIPPYGASSNSGAATTSELSGSEQSGSSGRGSAEDDGEDEEIRMINEGGPLQRDGLQLDGRLSDVSVQNTQEYLARLGIVDNGTTGNASNSSRRCSESMGLGSSKDAMLHTLPIDTLHMFHDDEHHRESDLTNLIYAKLNDVTNNSDRASSVDETVTNAGSIGATVDHVMMGGYGDVPVVGNQQGISMNGSLSSIVHSEEELTGSYNWDYLLDWGPQYQPLAHVFSEIARLKDDTLSVQSGNSGASSAKSKNSLHHTVKTLPPPLLTNVAPRSINVPVFAGRNNPGSHHGGAPNQYLLPRSPISHDSAAGFSTSSAMSPSFSPSLSPLATRSPSISPHVVSTGMPTSHHMVSLPRPPQQRGPAGQRKPY